MKPRAPLDFLKSAAFLANVGHLLGGYAVVMTAAFWAHSRETIGAVTFLLGIYVVVKEYVVDLIFESGENVRSSTVDALGYVAGALVAWAEVLAR